MKLVSLSKARKAKARVADRAQADVNALQFGRTKAQKAAEDAEKTKATRILDGHERES